MENPRPLNKSINIYSQGKERDILLDKKVTKTYETIFYIYFTHHTMQMDKRDNLDATSNCPPPPAKLYPEQNPGQDRILDQLAYSPCLNSTSHELNQSEPLNILLWEGSVGWEHISLQSGRTVSCMIIKILISELSTL